MSFRWFIYYSALCGACAAYVGWTFGRIAAPEGSLAQASVRGLYLGMMVALVLGLLDGLWNSSPGQSGLLALRALVVVLGGSIGGGLGAFIGQALYGRLKWSFLLLVGWVVTGLLVGGAVGVFDLLACAWRDEDLRGAWRKTRNGLLGGSLGGLLGGALYLGLRAGWQAVLTDPAKNFWSPTATGFVALGLCIGLLIALAQVILKEAWLKVEAGFRAGRELLLARPVMTIGRAEGCDVGLFGDAQADKLHARILRKGNDYLVMDLGSSTGTFINDERLAGPRVLHSGDLIRIGRSLLRFGERAKK